MRFERSHCGMLGSFMGESFFRRRRYNPLFLPSMDCDYYQSKTEVLTRSMDANLGTQSAKTMIETLLGINIGTLIVLLKLAFSYGQLVNEVRNLAARVSRLDGIPSGAQGD